jgi:hypothetical protein
MNNEFITLHFYIEVRGFHCSENRDTLSYYVSQDNAEISFVSLRYGALHTFFLIASGVGLNPLYCGHFWPIVLAPDDRWG